MIAIIDYGLGNVKAFANVYKRLDMPYVIASKADEINNATKIILPGVGAFDYAMELLNKSGMREKLEQRVLEYKIPVLGVCVGMQILGKSSEEGTAQGLDWIDGEVKKIRSLKTDVYPLPHMGWNSVLPKASAGIFKEIDETSRFYFLHTYYFQSSIKENIIATAEYGSEFACGVNHENIYGVQFHPEKSHQVGVQLLRNFGSL